MRILVVEDDLSLREAVSDSLDLAQHDVISVANGVEAHSILQHKQVDLVLSDINMPAMNGLELLSKIKEQQPWLPVVLMTAYGDVNQAVEAMQKGANDYLMKPFELTELTEVLNKFKPDAASAPSNQQPVCEDPSSKALFAMAERVAATDSTVLISGESGTGKEVLARHIHQTSERSQGPFVAINCAAIPENMLEAMLFGYEKGAYTGAYTSSPGKFEQASGGTLLLDEITEMDLALQAKLLRVLQERQVERLGGKKVIDLDVRIIATTNRDLAEFVAEGSFREDLYYRLSVFPLQWLPLRDRKADILPLANRLLAHHAQKMKRPTPAILADAQTLLQRHLWPGNVRELDNTMQRALILQTAPKLSADDFILTPVPKLKQSRPENAPITTRMDDGELGNDLKHREVEIIVRALKEEPSRKEAADRLGISARTLRYKIAKLKEEGVNIEQLLTDPAFAV